MSERIGIIAGAGIVPRLIADAAVQRGHEVYVAAFNGLAEKGLKERAAAWIDVGLARPSRIIRFFQKHGVKEAILSGNIRKGVVYSPTKFLQNIPDLRALAIWRSLPDVQDTTLLRAAADAFGSEGIEIVSAVRYLDHLLTPEGCITRRKPNAQEAADVAFGATIARKLAGMEIGQSIVVKRRNVVAVEATEGTDAAIKRGGELARGGAVLIKFSRPEQDLRFDVPGAGLATLVACAEAGIGTVALEAGRVLMYERDEMIALADRSNIAIVGVATGDAEDPE